MIRLSQRLAKLERAKVDSSRIARLVPSDELPPGTTTMLVMEG